MTFTPLVGARIRLITGEVPVPPNLTQPERHFLAPDFVDAWQREAPSIPSSGLSASGLPPRHGGRRGPFQGSIVTAVTNLPAGKAFIIRCGLLFRRDEGKADRLCVTGGVCFADTHTAGAPRHTPWQTLWPAQEGGARPPARLLAGQSAADARLRRLRAVLRGLPTNQGLLRPLPPPLSPGWCDRGRLAVGPPHDGIGLRPGAGARRPPPQQGPRRCHSLNRHGGGRGADHLEMALRSGVGASYVLVVDHVWLPCAVFAINNAACTLDGELTPLFIDRGQHPRLPLSLPDSDLRAAGESPATSVIG